MSSVTTRRRFIQSMAAGAVGLAGRRLTHAATAQSGGITATKLADNFTLLSGAGGNVLVVRSPEGLLMVDGGLPERADAFRQAIEQQAGSAPVRVLFNTHWHLEQTGSNDRVGRTGAKIIAHENTRLWMSQEITVEWQNNKVYPPRVKEARPNDTFLVHESPKKLSFGNESIQYGLMFQAHTDGDIYVFFPGPNILMAGDLVAVGHYPILDYSTHGWIGGMTNASRDLLQLVDAQTRIIPGTGPVQTKADVQAQFDMLSTVRQRLTAMMKLGYSSKDMAAEFPTREFDAKWGDPTLFMSSVYPGMWGHARELGGII